LDGYNHFHQIIQSASKVLRWSSNVLLQKIARGNRNGITLLWLQMTVTDIAGDPPQIVPERCSLVSPAAPRTYRRERACPSRDRDISAKPPLPLAGRDMPEEDRATS
jgi:hypothetical protein